MNENQGTYEKEINLMELLFYCLRKWRWVVAAMLVVAVLAGVYKFRAIRQSNAAKIEEQKQSEKTVVKSSSDEEEEDELEKEYDLKEMHEEAAVQGIKYYEKAIAQSEKDVADQEEYLKNSVIMQMDPNAVQTGLLSFHLDINGGQNEANALDVLTAAYRTYVTGGELAEELAKADSSMSVAELQELIVFGGDSNRYTYIADGVTNVYPKQNVVQVRIRALDERSCSNYMSAIEEALLGYQETMQDSLPGHELRLLTSSQTEERDADIQAYQAQIRSTYTSSFKNLINLRAELEALLKGKDLPLEGEEGVVEEETPLVLESAATGSVKFAIVGLVLGAFLAGFVLILIYIMSGRLQSTESFQEEFGMVLLGRVGTPVEKKRWFGFVDSWIHRLEEGAYANIPQEEQEKIVTANVKAAISKDGGLKNVMLAGTIAESDVQAICARLGKEIPEVRFTTYRQLVFCAADLEDLGGCDAVLFLEKKGKSVSQLIHQERTLAANRGVMVLGAVVL